MEGEAFENLPIVYFRGNSFGCGWDFVGATDQQLE